MVCTSLSAGSTTSKYAGASPLGSASNTGLPVLTRINELVSALSMVSKLRLVCTLFPCGARFCPDKSAELSLFCNRGISFGEAGIGAYIDVCESSLECKELSASSSTGGITTAVGISSISWGPLKCCYKQRSNLPERRRLPEDDKLLIAWFLVVGRQRGGRNL